MICVNGGMSKELGVKWVIGYEGSWLHISRQDFVVIRVICDSGYMLQGL